MLSCVAAGSAAVNGKLVAASEGGRPRKLASMAQRLFAAGASHPPTFASSSAASTPVIILYFHYHLSQPSTHNGLTNIVGAYS